MKKVFFI